MALAGPDVKPLHHVSRLADHPSQPIRGGPYRGYTVGDARQAPPPFPALFAGPGIERDQDSLVPGPLPAQSLVLAAAAAVARHDEQIAMENGRSAKAVLSVKGIAPFGPDEVTSEIQSRKTAVKEAGINPFAVGSRGGRKGVPEF
jgi:hypothetical protein